MVICFFLIKNVSLSAEFLKYEECASGSREECDNICSSSDKMTDTYRRFERYGQMHDLHGMVEEIGELCR